MRGSLGSHCSFRSAGVVLIALAALGLAGGCGAESVTFAPGKSEVDPTPARLATNDADKQDSGLEPSGGDKNLSRSKQKTGTRVAAVTPIANIFGEVPDRVNGQFVAAGAYNLQQHTSGDEGYESLPVVSPDGKTLVYSSTRHSKFANIYSQSVSGVAVVQLTNEQSDSAFATFAPGGQRIAFASNRSGSWNIYLMNRNGRNVTGLTNGPAQDMHPSFSPDGGRVAYCSLNARGQWEIWIVDLTTHERRQIGYGLFPSWSPRNDKDVIVFQRARERGGRQFSIWTAELADGEATSLTEITPPTSSAAVTPAWSPDGRQVVFGTVTEPADVDRHGRAIGQQDIWVINVDGSERRRLTDGSGVNTSPFWSSDGRIYFVSDRTGRECVWSIKTESRPIATADAFAE